MGNCRLRPGCVTSDPLPLDRDTVSLEISVGELPCVSYSVVGLISCRERYTERSKHACRTVVDQPPDAGRLMLHRFRHSVHVPYPHS